MKSITLNEFNKLEGRIIVKIITIIKTKIIINLNKIKHKKNELVNCLEATR